MDDKMQDAPLIADFYSPTQVSHVVMAMKSRARVVMKSRARVVVWSRARMKIMWIADR